MERGFYNEDIEELLKEKADQYKMYPSDKVWKGIHRSLHPNRKWYWLSLVLFLSAVGYYTFIEFIAPSKADKAVNGANASSTTSNKLAAETVETNTNNEPKAIIVPFGNPNKPTGTTGNSKQRNFILSPDNTTIVANTNTGGVVIAMKAPAVTANPPTGTETIAMADANEAPVYDVATGRLKRTWEF